MGFLARRRDERIARENDSAAEVHEWRAWVTGIAENMPATGELTAEVIAMLQDLPLRPGPAGVDADIRYATCRHYTSQLAAELSRKAILESEAARLAGDEVLRQLSLHRWRYLEKISNLLAF